MIDAIDNLLLAQALSLLIAIAAIFLGFVGSKWQGYSVLITSVGVTGFGLFTFEESLKKLYGNSVWFEWLIQSAANSIPGLITTWSELASLGSLVAGAAVAWVVLMAMVFMVPENIVIRGTNLLSKSEMTTRSKRVGVPKVPVVLGEFSIPRKLETRSISLCGEPGTGKTQLMLRMMQTVVERREPFVCIDVGGDIYRKFGRRRDVILSPVHEGSVDASPFAEIKTQADCLKIAESIIPLGDRDSKTWNGYARSLLTVILEKCLERGETTNRALINYSAYSTKDELKKLVKGTTAQRLFDSANEKKVDDVLGIVSECIKPIELLNPDAGKNSFSVREWISRGYKKGNLWIIYDDESAGSTEMLRSLWINLMITEAWGLVPNSKRRIWMFLDELASNGKIEMLPQAVSRLRKYGIPLVMAFQNLNQLNAIYGHDETKAILGSVGHSVILRTPDAETSEYLSRSIGEAEINAKSHTVSKKGDSSTSIKTEIRRAVLASEITQLEDLQGYIKLAGIGWAQLKVPIVDIANARRLVRKRKRINDPDATKEKGKAASSKSIDFDDI